MATRRLNEGMDESSTPRPSGREGGREEEAGPADATVGTQVAKRPRNVRSPDWLLTNSIHLRLTGNDITGEKKPTFQVLVFERTKVVVSTRRQRSFLLL